MGWSISAAVGPKNSRAIPLCARADFAAVKNATGIQWFGFENGYLHGSELVEAACNVWPFDARSVHMGPDDVRHYAKNHQYVSYSEDVYKRQLEAAVWGFLQVCARHKLGIYGGY